MIYVTGDKHGNFDGIKEFCIKNKTTRKDVLIILGDAGINYYLNQKDKELKDSLALLPITLFCIHGNHEERPNKIPSYTSIKWKKGIVYLEYEYPNILFAKDGEIYDLNGIKTIVIGGAYSVDKQYRLATDRIWYNSEQPDDKIKNYVESQLHKLDWKIDNILSHTCPKKFTPYETFLEGVDQSTFDHSTEEWLEEIEEKLEYDHWFFGHFHTEKITGKYSIYYESIKDYPVINHKNLVELRLLADGDWFLGGDFYDDHGERFYLKKNNHTGSFTDTVLIMIDDPDVDVTESFICRYRIQGGNKVAFYHNKLDLITRNNGSLLIHNESDAEMEVSISNTFYIISAGESKQITDIDRRHID